MRVYLDSAPVIYLVERHPIFFPLVRAALGRLNADLVSSDLTRMESLVRPLRMGDAIRVQEFTHFFATQIAEMVSVSPAVFDRAAHIRATHRFKTPDSIHLAAATESGCDAFLTNDQRLAAFPDVRIEVV